MTYPELCPQCGGRGQHKGRVCPLCLGSGDLDRPAAPEPTDPRMTPRNVDAVVEATRRAKLME